MSMRWRWAILGGGFGLYLVGLGFLGGVVAERVGYEEALKKWQAARSSTVSQVGLPAPVEVLRRRAR